MLILFEISMRLVADIESINLDKSSMVQVMTWCQLTNKPLTERMKIYDAIFPQ